MKRIPLKFCFKGQRNYVQGGDIYDEAVRAILESDVGITRSAPFRLAIHRFTRVNCDVIISSSDGGGQSRPDNPVAELSFQAFNRQVIGWVVENERPIACRKPYNEAAIQSECFVNTDERAIEIDGVPPFTPIEILISMTKQLHYAIYPTDNKWIFTRLDLKRLLQESDASALYIAVEHNFNNRLTRSRIEVNGKIVGQVFFSSIKQ